jgi:hypothetical protein
MQRGDNVQSHEAVSPCLVRSHPFPLRSLTDHPEADQREAERAQEGRYDLDRRACEEVRPYGVHAIPLLANEDGALFGD